MAFSKMHLSLAQSIPFFNLTSITPWPSSVFRPHSTIDPGLKKAHQSRTGNLNFGEEKKKEICEILFITVFSVLG